MSGNPILKEETLEDHIQSANEHMEELAAAGEWPDVAEWMRKRNAMLREVRDANRTGVLLAARSTTDRILRLAEAAKVDVGDKLMKLQRGKAATEIYRAHS